MDVQELKIKEEPQDDIDLDFNAVPYMDIKVENELILDDGYLSCTEDFRDDSTQNTEATETFSSSCQSLDSQLNRETTSVQLKNYQCANYCDFVTHKQHYLRRHTESQHRGGPKPYSCPLCSYSTVQSHHLKRHVLSRHSEERPFACTQCAYSTKRESLLRNHVLVKHQKRKPFPCPQPGCTYRSARTDYLKVHVMAKHSKQRRFNCPYCPYKSTFPQSLKIHVTKAHRDSES